MSDYIAQWANRFVKEQAKAKKKIQQHTARVFGFTREQHLAQSAELAAIQEKVEALQEEILAAYPAKSHVARYIQEANKFLRCAQTELQDDALYNPYHVSMKEPVLDGIYRNAAKRSRIATEPVVAPDPLQSAHSSLPCAGG